MVDYIRQNPAFAGMQAFQQRQANDMALDLDQLNYDEARRTADAERAVDEALRGLVMKRQGGAVATPGAMPGQPPLPGGGLAPQGFAQQPAPAPQALPTSPTGVPRTAMPAPPAAAPQPRPMPSGRNGLSDIGLDTGPTLQEEGALALARVPGGGKAAFDMAASAPSGREKLKDRMDDLKGVMDALKDGHPEIARFYAQEAGLQLPEEFWTDTQATRAFAEGKDWIDRFYKDDPETAAKFFQAAMEGSAANGGAPDWRGALQRVPPDEENAAKWRGKTAAGTRPARLQIMDALKAELGITTQQAWDMTAAAGKQDITRLVAMYYEALIKQDELTGDGTKTPDDLRGEAVQMAQRTIRDLGGKTGDIDLGGAGDEIPDTTGDPLEDAREAIRMGAPREAVIQELEAQGIDPSGL